MKLYNYLDQLEDGARAQGVTLHSVFVFAGIAVSTLYRARHGHTDISKPIADKIVGALEQIAALPNGIQRRPYGSGVARRNVLQGADRKARRPTAAPPPVSD